MSDEASARSSWLARVVVGSRPKRTLLRIVVLVVITFVVFRFLIIPIRISGISMSPNYEDGRIGIVYRLAYRWNKPARGDVVAIRMAGPRAMYMKRVIGLPGEHLSIRRGVIYIDGERLHEPYVKLPAAPNWDEEKQLGPHEYYLMGDNRSMDQDVHIFGTAREDLIVGKVIF